MLLRIYRERAAVECVQSDASEWVTEGGRERKPLATDGAFP